VHGQRQKQSSRAIPLDPELLHIRHAKPWLNTHLVTDNEIVREQNFFTESETTKPITLNCPYCHEGNEYPLRWVVRKKKNKLPHNMGERERTMFQKVQSYMVLRDDRVRCANLRCRKQFEVSGVKTTSFL
tara:strand:+ start:14869 stop:15258 length:390 start_codon:yes stop_codon:yes gene_type:complete